MYDGASQSDTVYQRAVGELRVSFKRRGSQSVLDDLRQAGCLKARFPRPVSPGWADATTLNTSGGVASGDQLSSTIIVGPGARATIASQAAERFYRAPAGGLPSIVRTRVTLAEGAAAEWLPQETILFDRCTVDRRLDIDLATDAWFLGVESLVFGRTAMGERVDDALVRDAIRIRRGGRWLLNDAVRLEGPVHATLSRPAISAGARAMATLVHVAPDAEGMLTPVRDALAECGAETGVSAWQGMLVARMLAADGAVLSRAVMAGLQAIRAPRPLPRVWMC